MGKSEQENQSRKIGAGKLERKNWSGKTGAGKLERETQSGKIGAGNLILPRSSKELPSPLEPRAQFQNLSRVNAPFISASS